MSTYPQPSFVAPPGACQVVLVRHGQSAPYVDGDPFPLVEGHADPPLSPRGLWQAEQVRLRLSEEPIGAIYVSSLTRTQQTAAPLAHDAGIEPRIEHDLREVYLGEFEGGLFRKMMAEKHPAAVEMERTGEWGSIPGAETNEQLRERTVAVIDRLVRLHRDQLIIVVCHGGVIAALIGHAMSQPLGSYAGSRHTALSHLVITERQWMLRSFNDAAHIGSLTTDSDPH